MNKQEYIQYDGLGLAELIKTKQVTSSELLDAAISEIETQNPNLNAVIYTRYEKARLASSLDSEGVFAGVPMLLKDISQEMKGEVKSLGSKALQNYRASCDSEYVKRLRKSGVLFLGQTNVPEFGLMAITEPIHYGPTRNPWNRDYTPGGSSGGSLRCGSFGDGSYCWCQ